VFVNVKQARETYKNEIENAEEAGRRGVEAATANALPGTWNEHGGGVCGLGDLFRGVMQGLDDSTGFTFAASVGDKGLTLEKYLKVAADSPTDKFFPIEHAGGYLRSGQAPSGNSLAISGTRQFGGHDGVGHENVDCHV
jgi:hypothetical protein